MSTPSSTPPSSGTLATPPSPSGGITVEEHAGEHQCGRCRKYFPVEGDQPPAAQREWWVCPPCHDSLFSGTSRRW